MQYQLEIPARYYRGWYDGQFVILFQTVFRLGIVYRMFKLSSTNDIVSHEPAEGVTKAAGMRRDSNGNPIYSVFMQPAVRPSVTSTDNIQL